MDGNTLQDTTSAQSVAEYLERFPQEVNSTFKTEYMEFINYISQESFNSSGVVQLWPNGLNYLENTSQAYHYFVPRYLMSRLFQLNKKGIRVHAALVSQLLVALYEVTSGGNSPLALLVPNFRYLEFKSEADMYAAYIGVCTFGNESKKMTGSCLTFNEFQRSLLVNTKNLMKRIKINDSTTM